MLQLLDLPHDILLLILQAFDAVDLVSLSLTCTSLRILVNEFGWDDYLRRNPRPSYSLYNARARSSPKFRVRYDFLTDHCWEKSKTDSSYVALPLSRQWRGKLQPVMAINNTCFVIAAARTLYLYRFATHAPSLCDAPPIELAIQYSLPDTDQARCDIRSIAFIDDTHFLVGFQNGGIEQLTYHEDEGVIVPSTPSFTRLHGDALVESLKTEGRTLLSLSSTGHAALTAISSSTSSQIDLNVRSWVAHLAKPYAAFGMSSSTPLTIHDISETQLSPLPSVLLGMGQNCTSSGVYGLCSAPPSSPWGPSPQVIVSGWYDGIVRCHDLRASNRALVASGSPSLLRPVMKMSDPLLGEPIYSVSAGGGSGCHIAAGSARHSVVSFWDVRSPARGWSVHAPGNDSSPVYDIILESSRLYGVTQSRPFVLDFGPGVTRETYPHVTRNPGRDGLKTKRDDGIGFYVTQYSHNESHQIVRVGA